MSRATKIAAAMLAGVALAGGSPASATGYNTGDEGGALSVLHETVHQLQGSCHFSGHRWPDSNREFVLLYGVSAVNSTETGGRTVVASGIRCLAYNVNTGESLSIETASPGMNHADQVNGWMTSGYIKICAQTVMFHRDTTLTEAPRVCEDPQPILPPPGR